MKTLPNEKEKLSALETVIDWCLSADINEIKKYIKTLQQKNPGISNDDLAKKVIKRKSFKNGLLGAMTGIGGILTLPVSIPANLVGTWKIQAFMIIAIAYIYGYTHDIKTDIYLIIAGNSAKEGLKKLSIEIGKTVTKKAINKKINREVMKKIWSVVGRKIITRSGKKSLTSFIKMVPLIGAPIGFVWDWSAAQFVGRKAIKYYSGKG